MSIVLNGTTGITTPAIDSVAPFSSADMPAGSVLQVVSQGFSTAISKTDATQAATGITATITPTSATSKILVLLSTEVAKFGGNTYVRLWFVRNGTTLTRIMGQGAYTGDTASNSIHVGASYLDSPSTTSAVTYTVDWSNPPATGTIELNVSASVSNITLMEIAA